MMVSTYFDHQLLRQHPEGTTWTVQVGDLIVTEPGTAVPITYVAGTWHAITNLPCGFAQDNPSCPRCHPPTPPPGPLLASGRPIEVPPLPGPLPLPGPGGTVAP